MKNQGQSALVFILSAMAKEPVKKIWYYDALQIFVKLSGWVLVPLIVGYTIGQWLDHRYSSEPKWFFISIGVAFILSMVGIIRQTQSEYKKINTPKK